MIGKQFLSAVIAEKSVSTLLSHGNIDALFKASESDAWSFVKDFVKNFASLPDPSTIEAHTGQKLMAHKEPSAYYFDLMTKRHQETVMKNAMKEANNFLLADNHDPEKALKTLADGVMQLISQKHAKQIIDFRSAYDMITHAYAASHASQDNLGMNLGWPTLDGMTGGLVSGDVVSFVGRPQRGKTWQMLYSALFDWRNAGKNLIEDKNVSRMFVSMEMGALPILQRLAAMQTHVNMSNLKKGALGSVSQTALKKGLIEIKGFGSPFYVIDGNLAATVEDIWMMARQLKPGGIFIDGAYLVKHPSERDRFKRVAENAELIKKELAPLAPVACSWQFAKTASKKKKDEKVTMDDIGYTDAIAQVSSLVLGLLEEESIETLNQRKIEILKGRSGETGSFLTNWNFQHMHFDEFDPTEVEELQFT